MITGYEAFGIYQALKIHFTTDDFDFFKYNGKIRISVNSFENRKDKYYFYKLSRKFISKDELIHFILYNLIENDKTWAGSLLEEQAEIYAQKHRKIIESLSYVFRNECESIFQDNINPNKCLEVVDGEYPELLIKTFQKDISLETLCILNKMLNFIPSWNKRIKDTIRWPEFKRLVLKYAPFIEIDIQKYKTILKDTINAN